MTLKFSRSAKAEDLDPSQGIQNGKNFLIFLKLFWHSLVIELSLHIYIYIYIFFFFHMNFYY